jgi:hypothetical protein
MKLFSEQELMQFEANSRFIDKFCSAVQTAEDMVNSTKWLPAGSYRLSVGKITTTFDVVASPPPKLNVIEKPLDIRYTEI